MTLRAKREGAQLPEAGDLVAVVGLSKSGIAVSRRLVDREVRVRLIEEFPGESADELAAPLIDIGVEVCFGSGEPGSGSVFLDGADLAVLSPGVGETAPIVVAAADAGLEMWSEPELGFRLIEARRHLGERFDLAAITGTNGKTSVTTVLAVAGQESGRKTEACGNIGYPFIDAACDVPSGSLLVAEISSFQLRFSSSFRPDVAVLLNFAPDHLDWHPDLAHYADAKGKIFDRQLAGDTAVWNRDDPGASTIAEAHLKPEVAAVPFTSGEPTLGGAGVLGGTLISQSGLEVVAVDRLPGSGRHVVENSLAVIAAGDALGLTTEAMAAAIVGFEGLPHRLEKVGSLGGVDFVDDSKATNPAAAARALGAFNSIVLIAGGKNKGLDLAHIAADEESTRHLRSVVAIGESATAVADAFSARGVETSQAGSMREAVSLASALAEPGDTVLLSPACASFDAYRNYAERGDDFRAEVERLSELSGGSE